MRLKFYVKSLMLRSTDYILLTLACVVDFIDALPTRRDVAQFSWGNSPPTYRKETLTKALQRLLATEQIEKVVKGGEAYYKITTKGFGKMQRLFPLTKFVQKKWDGKWRVAIFDVEEKYRNKRNTIRTKLKELSFAMLQKSVWVSPYNIEKDLLSFLKENNLEKGVLFLTTIKISVDDEKELIEKLWGLSDLSEEYYELIEKWGEIRKNNRHNQNYLKEQAANWEQKLFKLLIKDPHLPKNLLPEGEWYGETARHLYKKEIQKLLHSG